MSQAWYIMDVCLQRLIVSMLWIAVFAACEGNAAREGIDNQSASSAVAANSNQAPSAASTPQSPSVAHTPQMPSAASMPLQKTQQPAEQKASVAQQYANPIKPTGQPLLDEESLALWAKRPVKERKASVARWNREALAEANLNPSNLDMTSIDEAIRSCIEKYAEDDPGAREVLDELFVRSELKSMAKATQRACLATLMVMAEQ